MSEVNNAQEGSARDMRVDSPGPFPQLDDDANGGDGLELGLLGMPIDPHFDIEKFYRIGAKLGSGQFSDVFKGTSVADGEVYAIKVIRKQRLVSDKHRRGLSTEIGILKSCRHPNIVAVMDVFESPTLIYLVLEFAEGGELFDNIVNHGKYSELEASNMVRQIIKALQYLHERGIAHRDMKPENILLKDRSETRHIKLADFGLAKILSNLQTTFTPCGTPGYVAPEVLFMRGYGIEIDMWSVGVILYILLCGYPPFYDKVPAKLYEKIKSAEYKFHDKFWANISPAAKDLITRLLVVDPQKRLTPDQALKHPWLSGLTTPALPLTVLRDNLRLFNDTRRGLAPLPDLSPGDSVDPTTAADAHLDSSDAPAAPASSERDPDFNPLAD